MRTSLRSHQDLCVASIVIYVDLRDICPPCIYFDLVGLRSGVFFVLLRFAKVDCTQPPYRKI